MMGAGKTTLGKRLARECQLEFVDLDHEIERRTGVSVATVFEIEGEAGFRQRETQLLAEVACGKGCVVATGGGIVLSPINRARLLACASVVYLHAPAALLHARTHNDRSRPLLQVDDPQARIRQLVERRDPLYREVADLVVEAGRDTAAVAHEIKRAMNTSCKH
ncbi:MAG: shikimate kinase [Sulfuritalea sp.]|nr:shikimate kinase [Sulfuritalea sp.]